MKLTNEEVATMEAIRRDVHGYAETITEIAMRVKSRELVMLASQMSASELGLVACLVGDSQEDGAQHHDPTQPRPKVLS